MTATTEPAIATSPAPAVSARAKRELAVLLLGGAVGATLALLATRQELARVVVTPPRPLPGTIIALSWQDLLPAVAALAVASLASMAAVLATRGLARQITGLLAVALGIGIAVQAAGRVSAAAVLAAARHASISSAGAVGGTAPGSTTAGTNAGQGDGALTGFPSHVVFSGSAWRSLMLLGAVLVVAAGIAIMVRATRLPAMSARYERSGSPPAGPRAEPTARPKPAKMTRTNERVEAARMWESLTAGGDPTARSDEDAR